MSRAARSFYWYQGDRGGAPSPPVDPELTFQVTTTGVNQTLTINELRTIIGQEINVDWGDGQNNFYTSTGSSGNQRTHLYAAAGVYTVTIDIPDLVTHFDIRDTKVTDLQGAQLSKLISLTNLRILTVPNGVLDWVVGAAAPMPPLIQYLQIELQDGIIWTVDGDNPMPPINDVLNLRGVTGITWAHGSASVVPPLVESFTVRDSPGIRQRVGLESANDMSIVRIENGLTQAEVDDTLARFVTALPNRTVTLGSIDLLGSSNAAPSATGNAHKATLLDAGNPKRWSTVTTA